MTAKFGWASAVFACVFLLMGLSAQADHFSFKRLIVNGQERATIYSHGMDLFEITTSAGGYTPVQRAQVIVERLEKLADSHDFDAVRFSVGFRNGEVILQQDDPDHEPHLILTVDRRLGQRAGVSAERLAYWYIALLWDHLRLANGRRPTSTKGTQVGASFQKIHTRLGASEGHVAAEKIERALTALSEDEEEAFCKAACAVPPSFHPDRLQAERKPSKPLPPLNETDSHPSNSQPTITRRASQRKPPADPEEEHEHTRDSKSETLRDTHAESNTPLSKTVGRYRITLYPAPAAMKIGEKTEFQVKIAEDTVREKRLGDATVRVRLTRKEASPAPSIMASFDTQTEIYRFALPFCRRVRLLASRSNSRSKSRK